MGIVLLFAVPLNLVVFAAFWQFSKKAGEVQRTGMLYMARTLAAAVDAQFAQYVTLAQSFSHLPALLDDNPETFNVESRLASASTPEASISVLDARGRQLAGTTGIYGQGSADAAVLNPTRTRALETHAIVIGAVPEDSFATTSRIDIEVPIFKDGQPYRLLSVAVNAQAFSHLLNERHLPSNWTAWVADNKGRHIISAPEGEAGHLDHIGLSMAQGQDDRFDIFPAEGAQAVQASARSPASGWVSTVAIKNPLLQTAVMDYVRWATIITAGLSVLSVLLASAMARGITGSIEELRLKAGALVSGRSPSTPQASPREISELWQALKQSVAARDRSDDELRESKEKLRLALDAAELGVWRWDAGKASGEMHWDTRCKALFGLPPEAPVTYEVWANSIALVDRGSPQANVARALDPADPHDESLCEYRIERPDGTVRWVSSIGRVFFENCPKSASGRRAVFMAGVIRDVTDAREIEEQLRKSEERLRLSTEAAGIGTFTLDVESGTADYSPELAAMLGVPEVRTARIEDAFARVHREDEARVRARFAALLGGQCAPKLKDDFRFVLPGGEVRWMTWAGRLEFRDCRSGRVPFRIFGACVDITQRKRHEDQINFLMHEVNHRAKNMLSVVLAIARQTAMAEPSDFVERFGERVHALAASQDLLIKNEWRGVELSDLILSQLAHFKDLIGTRIQLKGPGLLISASAAQTIGMAMHELATNAGKYGALTTCGGCVAIEWNLKTSKAGETAFSVSWRETCLHKILPPSRSGFGSMVIGGIAETSLNAKVEVDFAVQGLSWKLTCPVAEVVESGSFTTTGSSSETVRTQH